MPRVKEDKIHVLVRFDPDLHAQLTVLARMEQRSLNAQIGFMLNGVIKDALKASATETIMREAVRR